MKRRTILSQLASSLVVLVCFAQPAAAAELGVFHLDQGFIGRAVNLQLDAGRLVLSWNAGSLVKEAELQIFSASPTQYMVRTSDVAAWPKKIKIALKTEGVLGKNEDWRIEENVSGTWVGRTSVSAKGYVTAEAAPGNEVRLNKAPRGLRKGDATWYRYKGCLCAASPDFPKGTKLLVKRVDDPSKSVIVRVNDYGPDRRIFPKRAIDLDAVAFKQLARLSAGVVAVTVEPL
ncbi:MAG: septal ring lytic transglycosylase RlpA family protein [Patescibacteria group bacterium]